MTGTKAHIDLRPLTIDEAKSLNRGQIIFDREYSNADGSPARWRVSGQVRVWKRDGFVRVPLKHGLYDYGAVTSDTLARFSLGR